MWLFTVTGLKHNHYYPFKAKDVEKQNLHQVSKYTGQFYFSRRSKKGKKKLKSSKYLKWHVGEEKNGICVPEVKLVKLVVLVVVQLSEAPKNTK